MTKQRLVSYLFERNYMVPPDLLRQIPDDFDYDAFLQSSSLERVGQTVLITEDMFADLLPMEEEAPIMRDTIETSLELIQTYVDKPKKREIQDFVAFMKARYKVLKKLLLQRSQLQGAVSINKAKGKQSREPCALIGFVVAIDQTKNGHMMLRLEDPTGEMKVLVSAKNEEGLKLVEELVLDEVIGVVGTTGDDIVFANEIFFPDIPMQEFKKTTDDVCVCFISDLHVGSNLFAKKEFERCMDWLNLKWGNEEQKTLARKVKYLIINGDLIDGVGIYPGQDDELTIKDIYGQYEALAEYLSTLRPDIKMVCIGGNHDALRLAEPQPPLSPDFARAMYKVKNLKFGSNPCTVRIHKKFDILMYHGYCFDYYMNNVDFIRNAGGYAASEVMMEFCLKKRHLAPTHVSTLKIPDIHEDPLVITHVPDFFVTGHIHYDVKFQLYKNVTLIGCSSFQYTTAFQEKLGHVNIVWGKVPVINLKTRQKFTVDFRDPD